MLAMPSRHKSSKLYIVAAIFSLGFCWLLFWRLSSESQFFGPQVQTDEEITESAPDTNEHFSDTEESSEHLGFGPKE